MGCPMRQNESCCGAAPWQDNPKGTWGVAPGSTLIRAHGVRHHGSTTLGAHPQKEPLEILSPLEPVLLIVWEMDLDTMLWRLGNLPRQPQKQQQHQYQAIARLLAASFFERRHVQITEESCFRHQHFSARSSPRSPRTGQNRHPLFSTG
jgi:hypothetical protein